MMGQRTTKCLKFELNPVMPETYPIRLEGNVLEWTTSIKHVGIISGIIYQNLMRSGINSVILLESLMVFHWARNHDVTPKVLIQLTSSYCTHLYGSQALQFNDTNVHRIFTTWNKAIKRIWNLPTHSHRMLLCGLNEGNHVYDYVFKRFIKMYNSMKCKNIKLYFSLFLLRHFHAQTNYYNDYRTEP